MLAERLLASIASASFIVIPYSPASSWHLRFRSTYGRLTRELGIDQQAIARTVALLDEGNTVPFITRYRRDQTGGLDEEQIGRSPRERREAAAAGGAQANDPRSIESQHALTRELREQIERADSVKRLEDLYLPYRPKKQTLATKAQRARAQPAGDGDPHAGQSGRRSRCPRGRLRQHR